MLLISILTIFGATGLAYYLHNQTEKHEQIPSLEKVVKVVERFGKRNNLPAEWSEDDLEKFLLKHLQIHFRQVRRQFPVGEAGQRERIDIDIGNGGFGIEIKLTHLLKKTNERNRLLGQIDTYQSRRYTKNRLLVVIAGEAGWESTPIGIEVKQILAGKGAGFVFLTMNIQA